MLYFDILVIGHVTDNIIVGFVPLSTLDETKYLLDEGFPLSNINVILVNQKIVFSLVAMFLIIMFN